MQRTLYRIRNTIAALWALPLAALSCITVPAEAALPAVLMLSGFPQTGNAEERMAASIQAAAPNLAQATLGGQEHCVAYRTVKGMFWLFDAEIVGRSCLVQAQLLPVEAMDGLQQALRVEVQVPISSLDSNNRFRDRHVAELLGADSHPTLRFVSGLVTEADLRGFVSRGPQEGEAADWPLAGHLELGGRRIAVTFALRMTGSAEAPVVSGRLRTTFAALGVKVPSVGPGGMVAAPAEAVELLANL